MKVLYIAKGIRGSSTSDGGELHFATYMGYDLVHRVDVHSAATLHTSLALEERVNLERPGIKRTQQLTRGVRETCAPSSRATLDGEEWVRLIM